MTYSTGPGGYGGAGQGPSSQGNPGDARGTYNAQPSGYTAPTQAFSAQSATSQAPAQSPGESKGLPFFLTIAVAALGAVNFLLGGFAETFFLPGLALLLAGGAVAGFAVLPKQAALDVVVAGLSVAGFLALLFAFVGPDNGLITASLGYILLLVLAFVQAALAVAVVLFASDIIKAPQPGPKQQPQYGYYGQGYGQLGYGQSQPQQPYYGGGAGQTYQPQPPPHQPQQSGQSQPPQQQQW